MRMPLTKATFSNSNTRADSMYIINSYLTGSPKPSKPETYRKWAIYKIRMGGYNPLNESGRDFLRDPRGEFRTDSLWDGEGGASLHHGTIVYPENITYFRPLLFDTREQADAFLREQVDIFLSRPGLIFKNKAEEMLMSFSDSRIEYFAESQGFLLSPRRCSYSSKLAPLEVEITEGIWDDFFRMTIVYEVPR